MATDRVQAELVVRLSDEAEEDDYALVTTNEPFPVTLQKRSFGTQTATSAANTALTFTMNPTGRARNIIYALVKYSAAPTQTGVIIALTPAAGDAFSTTLQTGSANAQSNFYTPSGGLLLLPGDKLVITAPAAGGSITASVIVGWEWVNG